MENCASSEFLNQWLVGEDDCHNWLRLRVSPSLELDHRPNPHCCQGGGATGGGCGGASKYCRVIHNV